MRSSSTLVRPTPASMGGLAVFQYQDGKEAAYFSFYGTAMSSAPFALQIKGDRAATTAMTEVSTSSITIENCSELFSPVVPNAADGAGEPPAPGSCLFTYKLAPGPAREKPVVTTNLVATPAMKSDLLTVYLQDHGWQSQYASEISVRPGTTYVGYDPQTGLDWALADFDYTGPANDVSGSPSVAMQDGGNTGIFYEIPVPGALPSYNGWAMVSSLGVPACFSSSVLPKANHCDLGTDRRSVLLVARLTLVRDGEVESQGQAPDGTFKVTPTRLGEAGSPSDRRRADDAQRESPTKTPMEAAWDAAGETMP
jgi:hypothetical protein